MTQAAFVRGHIGSFRGEFINCHACSGIDFGPKEEGCQPGGDYPHKEATRGSLALVVSTTGPGIASSAIVRAVAHHSLCHNVRHWEPALNS